MRVVDIFELLEDYPIILNTRNWINKQDETCLNLLKHINLRKIRARKKIAKSKYRVYKISCCFISSPTNLARRIRNVEIARDKFTGWADRQPGVKERDPRIESDRFAAWHRKSSTRPIHSYFRHARARFTCRSIDLHTIDRWLSADGRVANRNAIRTPCQLWCSPRLLSDYPPVIYPHPRANDFHRA